MKNLRLVMTALVTPFRGDQIDYDSLSKLVEQQLRGGIEGFVVHGTTAESPTTTTEEKAKVFAFIRKQVPPDFVLVAGTGENSTAKTVDNTKMAEEWGADAALVVVPYYNKPPQRGLFEHFKTVAESTRLPVLLYNVPGRTVTSLELETVEKLSRVPGIVGIKEASGNIDFARKIRQKCGGEFVLLSGDDPTYGDFLAAGGDGVISVASHVIPERFVEWTTAARKGQPQTAVQGVAEHLPLMNSLFLEANPIPVKRALAEMGILERAEMRLPLVEMDSEKAAQMRRELVSKGLLQ